MKVVATRWVRIGHRERTCDFCPDFVGRQFNRSQMETNEIFHGFARCIGAEDTAHTIVGQSDK